MGVKVWSLVAVGMAASGCTVEAQRDLIATLPMAADAGTSLFVRGRVKGHDEGWWVLDTGASECIIDRSTARSAKLVTRGGRQIGGAGKGSLRLDSVRSGVALDLAGRPLATCDHFGAADLLNANLQLKHPVSGILGSEFFARYIVRIDFGDHTVTLYDPGRYRYAGTGDTIALLFVKRVPRVPVRIRTANRPEVTRNLIADTGSEDFVDDSVVRRNPRAPGVTVSTTGLGKSYEAVIGTLDTVRIGRSLFTNVPGVASDVGIVGNGIWSKFVCIFDYPHHRVFLEPRR